MSRIKSLRVSAVRGIRQELAIALDGRSLLIRGDNGTGKSSLVQALSLALTGVPTGRTVRALPEGVVQNLRESAPGAMRVSLELSCGGEVCWPAPAKSERAETRAYREACRHGGHFLRRDEVVAVLNDEGAPRLRYFEGFLELSSVETLEKGVGDLVKQLNERAGRLAGDHRRYLDSAVSQLQISATPGCVADVLTAALGAASQLGIVVSAGAAFEVVREAVAVAATKAHATRATRRRESLVVDLEVAEQLKPPDHPKKTLTALRAAERSAAEAPLLDLLNQASVALEAQTCADVCPVCEQDVERDALQRRLRERIAALDELRVVGTEAQALAASWHKFLDGLEQLEAKTYASEAPAPTRGQGRALLEELDSASGLSVALLTRLTRLREQLRGDLQKCPSDVAADALMKLRDGFIVLDAELPALRAVEAERTENSLLMEKLKALKTAIGNARKDVVAEELNKVSSLVGRYYEAIHPPTEPSEATGAPGLKIARQGGGTAKLTGRFDGSEVDDPRDVYSDGHLDTVGICLFLALRRSRADRASRRDAKLMVLDDIIMSIDMGHAARLLDVLRDEFHDHQIILASHNELFMKLAGSKLSQTKRLNIHSWTLDDGPKLVGHRSRFDKLRDERANAGEVCALAGALGQALEELVPEACHAFAVSLPFRCEDLGVGEDWPALVKKLKSLAKDGVLADPAPALARIGDPTLYRNAIGAHLREQALGEVSLGHVQEAADGQLALQGILCCAECGACARLQNRLNPQAGLRCECRNGGPPNIPCQRPTTLGVEGA